MSNFLYLTLAPTPIQPEPEPTNLFQDPCKRTQNDREAVLSHKTPDGVAQSPIGAYENVVIRRHPKTPRSKTIQAPNSPALTFWNNCYIPSSSSLQSSPALPTLRIGQSNDALSCGGHSHSFNCSPNYCDPVIFRPVYEQRFLQDSDWSSEGGDREENETVQNSNSRQGITIWTPVVEESNMGERRVSRYIPVTEL